MAKQSPVLADTVLADTVLADTALADTVLASPVLAGAAPLDSVAVPAGAPAAAPATRQRAGVLAVLALPAADAAALAVAGASAADGPSTALYALAVLGIASLSGLHRLRICLRVSDQIGRLLAATLLPVLLLLPLEPAGVAVRLALTSAVLVVAARLIACAVLRALHRRGRLTEPALIVGAGTFGVHLAGQIRAHPELGLRVRGFLDVGTPRRDLPAPSLGQPADLAGVVAALGIRRVIVCFGDWRDEDLVGVLRACRQPAAAGAGAPAAADICVVPRLHELGLAVPRACLDEIWGTPLIPLRRIGGGPAGPAAKRAFDLVAGSLLLVATLPLLAVLATAITLQSGLGSGRSPLFRQQRVTGAGRQAEILKLRTITDSADSATCWAVDDQRCSRLGRWLRASHLDELPQLVNVLRGDLSLVGPRPERGYFAERFGRQIPRYGDRDRMRAGLTGWAQVHGLHGDTSIAERSRFDNTYIEYWSPWLDLVILVRTIGSALPGTGGQR
jgi:lipopolysaccharide/colanic/teichoic acid biosynthesis glycosyltransferase